MPMYFTILIFFIQQKEYDQVLDHEMTFVLAESIAASKGENEVCGLRDDGSISVL